MKKTNKMEIKEYFEYTGIIIPKSKLDPKHKPGHYIHIDDVEKYYSSDCHKCHQPIVDNTIAPPKSPIIKIEDVIKYIHYWHGHHDFDDVVGAMIQKFTKNYHESQKEIK